jgi:nicotinate-nucleotide pyrophosphorylase (carboxylating)
MAVLVTAIQWMAGSCPSTDLARLRGGELAIRRCVAARKRPSAHAGTNWQGPPNAGLRVLERDSSFGAERTALNLLSRMSGVATGLRTLEKEAVRLGGGANHRFGLDDAMLIKDNHIALAGGVLPALERAKRHAGHLVKIELEVDTLDQLAEALAVGVDAVLLDNMTPETMRRAVAIVDGRAITEASGRINLETAPAVAATGVDLISSGWITHSAPILDLGLDIAG